jgi:hypothetical protein
LAISATSAGTITAAERPIRPWAASITVATGLNVINTCPIPNSATTTRKTRVAPKRWTSLAPSMTKPATASEYMTIPVPTVVGGTPKLRTMPPIATGKEATLNDMIAWPSAIAIIGTQDSRTSVGAAAVVGIACVAMTSSSPDLACGGLAGEAGLKPQASTRTGPIPASGTGTWRRAAL